MIITRAETILVSIPFKAGGIPPWSFGGDPKCNFDTLLIRLETDSGLVGWGEAFSRNEDRALKAMIDTRVLPDPKILDPMTPNPKTQKNYPNHAQIIPNPHT